MHLWGLFDGLGSHQSNQITNKNSPSNNEPKAELASKTIEQGSHNILSQYLDEDDIAMIDPFDAVQLAYVIEVCIHHKNQAAAGRYLYANSRDKLKNPNDSDRLRKYLMKFRLRFDELN